LYTYLSRSLAQGVADALARVAGVSWFVAAGLRADAPGRAVGNLSVATLFCFGKTNGRDSQNQRAT